jgi:hypothetical protein
MTAAPKRRTGTAPLPALGVVAESIDLSRVALAGCDDQAALDALDGQPTFGEVVPLAEALSGIAARPVVTASR